MSGKKQTWILWIILGVLVASSVWYLFIHSIKTNGDAWKMLPDTPSLILEFDKPGKVYENIQDNPIWKSLTNTLLFKRVDLRIGQLDSLLNKNTNDLRHFKNKPLLVAFYNNSSKGLSTLFLSSVALHWGSGSIKHFLMNRLGPDYAVEYAPVGKYNLFKVIDAIHNMRYYFTFLDGVFAFSMDEQVIRNTMHQYSEKNKGLNTLPAIIRLRKYEGKKTEARIFINYPALAATLKNISAPEVGNATGFLAQFAQWSETDLLIKNKELLLTGYTMCSSDGDDFLTGFNKKENPSDVYNIVPYDANILLSINGLALKKQLDTTPYSSFQKSYLHPLKKLTASLENGVSLFTNAVNEQEYHAKLYLALRMDTKGLLTQTVDRISQLSGSHKKYHYQKYTIKRVLIKQLWKKLLGKAFAGIQGNYYTQMGNFVVFANSRDALQRLIDLYETGKTADLNHNFKKLTDNMQSKANLTLWIKPRLLAGLFQKYINKALAVDFRNNMETIDDFQNIVFQFSKVNKLFYTNFYVQFSKSFHEENLSLWKTTLDGEVAGKPFLVKNSKSGYYDLIVFDKKGRMYLMNANGKILWKKKLVQPPMSGIEQVDYYKNGKIQFLFNTEDNLYLIDRKGRFTGNYPIRLNPSATNGVSLFDYTKRKDYRLLIAQADKRVYDYNVKGQTIKGWAKPKMGNIVTAKVQRLIANKKDYILITDIDNHVRIVNRKGKIRIHLKGRVNKARNSIFYVNRTNGKGILLTTDKNGRLTYISSSGKIKHTNFGTFSPEHYFLYEDFNGDGWRDFIFLDNRKLTVFDRFKKVLFSYTFQTNIHNKPVFFTLGKGQRALGVVAAEEKTIYLFDNKGNTLISKGLIGETPFTVGSIKNNAAVNLITATGSILYNYRIK